MRRNLIIALLGAVLIMAGGLSAVAETGPPVATDKKLLGWAVNALEPASLRRHIAELEQELALDGLVIALNADDWTGPRNGQEYRFFGGHRFTVDDFRQVLDDLKNTRFTSFKHNFFQFATSATGAHYTSEADANLDWFDPNWSVVANNAAVIATVAREAGFEGLWLDVEGYQPSPGPWGTPFDYRARPDQDKRSLAEVSAQVRKRGRQFMAAIVGAYANITIVVIPQTGEWDGFSSAWQYELLAPFVDGMLEALGPEATLVNGLEKGYPLRTYAEFLSLRAQAETEGRQKSQAGPLFDRMRYGMGLFVDSGSEVGGPCGGWHTDPHEFDKNYRTPEGLEHTLYYALTAVDPGSYVWLYVWHPQVWYNPEARKEENLSRQPKQCVLCPHREVPQAYLDAFRHCREPHDLARVPETTFKRTMTPKELADRGNDILMNGDLESWTVAGEAPDHWIASGQEPAVYRELKEVKSGRYALRLTTALPHGRGHVFIDQSVPAQPYAGKTVTLGAWVTGEAGAQILDFANGSVEVGGTGTEHIGQDGWRFRTNTKAIRTDADTVVFRLGAHLVSGVNVYIDEASAVVEED